MDTSKSSYGAMRLLFFALVCLIIEGWCLTANATKLSSQALGDFLHGDNRKGTTGATVKKWAVLVAGSNGWGNYRHQVKF